MSREFPHQGYGPDGNIWNAKVKGKAGERAGRLFGTPVDFSGTVVLMRQSLFFLIPLFEGSGFEQGNKRQVAVFFFVIQTVADHEFIG